MNAANVLCPKCSGPTAREYDKEFRATGKRICLNFLTCPQTAFYHIPTAQEIETTGRILGPAHEADLSTCSNADLRHRGGR